MSRNDIVQIVLYFIVLIVAAPLLGRYIASVFSEKKRLHTLDFLEKSIYKYTKIDAATEMHWTTYLYSLLLLNALGIVVLFLLQLLQGILPLNPSHLKSVEPLLALNTAISFVTNTNWQAYSGESTLSYSVQMFGLTVQNFLSAATGMAVLVALARGLSRSESRTIGNFWVDITRSVLYIFLPLSCLLALILVSQGVVQTFRPSTDVHTLSGVIQTIPLGPAASQIAIKQLGTNGGGFFGVNSAHPFENPTPLSNFLEMIAILLIPAAQVIAFGLLIKNKRHGILLLSVMMLFLTGGFAVALYGEMHSPGNYLHLEGKETRIGIAASVLWETVTTAASNGSVNAMHDSMSPLAIFVALVNMMLGEIVFGGAGSGLYGMVIFVILTIFLSGLMIGRTPQYLGKKIESREMKWTMVALLTPNIMILLGTSCALLFPAARACMYNPAIHGLTEILYAFTSAAANNGSALGGLSANNPFYTIGTGIAMLAGRYGVIIPICAIAGSFALKTTAHRSEGDFRTDTTLFAIVLVISIIIVGALTFVPVLLLGPIAEHLLYIKGYFTTLIR
ncbi:MAG: potassium-transporting ATPase subunit KdpA [Fibrobacterota bacterium]|nr:potassium-transporting ATPase subunit KdpA [Chitinispirillaceae bacterium]